MKNALAKHFLSVHPEVDREETGVVTSKVEGPSNIPSNMERYILESLVIDGEEQVARRLLN